ncbi:hypothetical protein P3W45_001847 [Vairimorpha bombi]
MKKSVDAVSTAQVTRSLSVKLQDCIIWRNLRGGDKNNHGRNKGQSKESELYSVNICEKVKMTRIINNLNDLTSRHSEVLGNTEGRITYISEEKFYIRTKFYIRMKREEIISDNAKVFSSEEIRKWIIIMRSYSSNGSQARRL